MILLYPNGKQNLSFFITEEMASWWNEDLPQGFGTGKSLSEALLFEEHVVYQNRS